MPATPPGQFSAVHIGAAYMLRPVMMMGAGKKPDPKMVQVCRHISGADAVSALGQLGSLLYTAHRTAAIIDGLPGGGRAKPGRPRCPGLGLMCFHLCKRSISSSLMNGSVAAGLAVTAGLGLAVARKDSTENGPHHDDG
jgi:hypothetical protein